MTGIAFVRDGVDEPRDAQRQIGIDVDARLAAPQIPVVRAPRLVRHRIELERFIVGQGEARVCQLAQPLGDCRVTALRPARK